jgi:hypothetical protein
VTTPEAEPPFDVFLSCHSADGDWVASLEAGLPSKGIRVWLDSEQRVWTPRLLPLPPDP